MKPNGQLGEWQKKLWAMEPRALEGFMRSVAPFELDPDKFIEASAEASIPRKSRIIVVDATAVIPITGFLMKSPPAWLRKYFDITGYEEVVADINAALEDGSVERIMLHVDSPGGEVAGVQEAADAIFAARKVKPVKGFIEDLGASGAYYLASQAQELGTNLNGLVGSIGVYAVYMDLSKMADDLGIKVHVIRSGEHKGMGVSGAPISEEQIKGIQEVIDDMAANFRAAVERGRGLSASKVKKLATGQIWLGEKSRELGLVDRVTTIEAMITGNTDSSEVKVLSEEAGVMAEENEKKDQAEKVQVVVFDEAAIKAEAAEGAKKEADERLAALKAAFPDDLAFAIEQYEAGVSVQEAKAAFAGVLQEKLKASEKEKTELAEKLKASEKEEDASGVEPVGFGGTEGGETDFVKAAIALAEEKKITKTAAMQKLAAEKPEMFAAWKAGQKQVEKK